jgi:hypothetical protein
MDEGTGSAADPGLVEEAVPESDATKVAEEAAVKATQAAAANVKAIDETIKKATETKPAPEPTETEVALAPTPQTMEEYKELKAEVKAESAALNSEPAPLDEEE